MCKSLKSIFIEHWGLVLGEDDGEEKAIPEVVRRAMEKAKDYKENKGVMSNVDNENPSGTLNILNC